VLNTLALRPATDCSVLDTWLCAPCPDCSVPGTCRPHAAPGSLRVQHLPLRSMRRLLRARPFASRPGHELLRVRHLAFGLAAGLLRPLNCLPYAVRRLLGVQHLALRAGHELLRARHLAFRPEPGCLRALDFPPCVDPRLLGDQHFALCLLWIAPCSTLSARTGHGLLRARHLTPPCFPQSAPRSTT